MHFCSNIIFNNYCTRNGATPVGDIEVPDGLELLLLALLFGESDSKGALSALDRRRRCRLLLLQRMKLVDRLSLHRRRAVVVAHPIPVLLRLNLRQSVPRRPVPVRHRRRSVVEAELPVTVTVRRHPNPL